MGVTFYYDAMHDVPENERIEGQAQVRQVQVFRFDRGQFWLRLGPVGGQDEAVNRYTVRLTAPQAAKLARVFEETIVPTAG